MPSEAELEEIWVSDGFGLFEVDEGLSVEEMNQEGWQREMRSRDKDKISLCELLSKDCLDKKPRSGRPKALTDTVTSMDTGWFRVSLILSMFYD